MLNCSCVFCVYCEFDLYGLALHHKCVWSWIWFPGHHELQFFSSVLLSFSPLRVQSLGVLRAFRAVLIFLDGQLYGCQVTINSIYGLDKVAKKGLLWSTQAFSFTAFQKFLFAFSWPENCINFICFHEAREFKLRTP